MKRHDALRHIAIAALIVSIALAGCAEYMDRKDTIAFNAGEAVQTNVIAHVPDPWPAHSRNKNIAFSGERIARAVRRYECGPPAGGQGASGQTAGQSSSGASEGAGQSPSGASEGAGQSSLGASEGNC
jgi:hypothetical protein